MRDSIIITGISLFDNEEVYVDDIPEEIKNIFISDKTSEMTMSVVNTFLDAYGCEKIKITVEGNTLESGHAEYPRYMNRFE